MLEIFFPDIQASSLNACKISNTPFPQTDFIADAPESLDMLTQLGKDYAGAQSSIEWAEFAGGGIFEIVLTALLLMFTCGVGNVAQGARDRKSVV